MSFLDNSKVGRALVRGLKFSDRIEPVAGLAVGISAGLYPALATSPATISFPAFMGLIMGGVSVGGTIGALIGENIHLNKKKCSSAHRLLDENGVLNKFNFRGTDKDLSLLKKTLSIIDGIGNETPLEPRLSTRQEQRIEKYMQDLAEALPRIEMYDNNGRPVSTLRLSRTYTDTAGGQQRKVIGSISKHPNDLAFEDGKDEVEKILPPSSGIHITAQPNPEIARLRVEAQQSVQYLDTKREIDEALNPLATTGAATQGFNGQSKRRIAADTPVADPSNENAAPASSRRMTL
jgi:hypothetical protein